MKQRFMKLISCLLVIALLLPTIALLPVAAADEEDIYDLRGTTLIPNIHPIDWIQAFNDGVTWFDWGYFHRAVQKEIRIQYGLSEGELYIPGSGKNGGKAFDREKAGLDTEGYCDNKVVLQWRLDMVSDFIFDKH